MAESYIVDKRGRKKEVILELKRYHWLTALETVIDLKELLETIEHLLKEQPPAPEAIRKLLEDLDDLVEVAKRQSEKTIPWDRAKRSLIR